MYQYADFHYTKLSMPNPEYVLLGGARKLSRMIPSLHTSLGTASLESDERRKAMMEERDTAEKIAEEAAGSIKSASKMHGSPQAAANADAED